MWGSPCSGALNSFLGLSFVLLHLLSVSGGVVHSKEMMRDTKTFVGGVNLQPSYYNGGNVTMGWETMKNFTEIQAVRIEIEPDMVEQGREWIRQASEQGYQMIVTYHKYEALGSDDSAELQAAAEWWRVNYQSLSQAGTFEVNLMNEWSENICLLYHIMILYICVVNSYISLIQGFS
jgi:hypothetical protein